MLNFFNPVLDLVNNTFDDGHLDILADHPMEYLHSLIDTYFPLLLFLNGVLLAGQAVFRTMLFATIVMAFCIIM